MLQKIKKMGTVFLSLVSLYSAMYAGKLAYSYYMYDFKGKSVVYMVSKGGGGGTGFQVKAPSGIQYTLTNRHICEGEDRFMRFVDEYGNVGLIEIIEISKNHDLCILSAVENLRPLYIASSIAAHESAHVLGHPSLRPLTMESGYFIGNEQILLATHCAAVTPFDNEIESPLFEGLEKCVIELLASGFNANSYPGNSGSPILNDYGNVISVLFAGTASQPDISYGVPLYNIKEFLKDY